MNEQVNLTLREVLNATSAGREITGDRTPEERARTIVRKYADKFTSGETDQFSFVQAIKDVRAATGWGLREAKNFVKKTHDEIFPPKPEDVYGSTTYWKTHYEEASEHLRRARENLIDMRERNDRDYATIEKLSAIVESIKAIVETDRVSSYTRMVESIKILVREV
jgi:hypothetical protein